ncbi:MAG TPA: molybdopterin-dependent oxidoreductase, partial [Dehalococcoidia bacterium]|nr:molybdopterin-dependent oxidoreductase [Dehalococcoidia bacterium]
ITAANGPDAIAVLGSAKLTNEENYLIGKLARTVIGTNNVDHSRSPYHRGTIEGLMGAFGVPASTASLSDLENAAAVFVIGNDTHNETQVAALKIKQNVMRRGAQLIVAHPLETNLHKFAQLALRYRPGTEVALVNAVAAVCARLVHESVSGGAAGRAEYVQSLVDLTPERGEELTGVPAADIVRAAEMLTGLTLAGVPETGPDPEKPTRPACLVYGSGLSWHEAPVDLVRAIANLAILTGNVNRPKSGISVQLSENNLQGATDMGVVADLLPGYVPVAESSGVWSVWGAPLATGRPRGFWQIIEAIEAGTIKALICFTDQPLAAAAESDRVRAALQKLDYLVAVDHDSRNEVTRFADAVLPGVTFAEKDGTYTNLERRVQRIRPVIAPVGEARPDWQIVCDLARTLGATTGFDFAHAGEVFDEIARVVPEYAGLDYDRLAESGIQWPCPSPDHPDTPQIQPTAVRFQPVTYDGPAAQSAGGQEFLLVTGRSIFTTVDPNTHSVYPMGRKLPDECFAWLNEDDADRLGVTTGDPVRIRSSLGEIALPARAVDWQQPGVVYVPIDAAGAAVQRLIPHTGRTPPAEAWAVRVTKG